MYQSNDENPRYEYKQGKGDERGEQRPMRKRRQASVTRVIRDYSQQIRDVVTLVACAGKRDRA